MTDWLDAPGHRIAAEHDALVAARALNPVLLLDYRCPQGCLLLHVWQSPRGRLFYLPRYQLSAAKNAETAEPARMRRTEDGDHKWPARGGVLDDVLGFGGLSLNCRHLRRGIAVERLAADSTGTPGRPTRRRIAPDD